MVICIVYSPGGWIVVDGSVERLGRKLDPLCTILLICNLILPYTPRSISEVAMPGRRQD